MTIAASLPDFLTDFFSGSERSLEKIFPIRPYLIYQTEIIRSFPGCQ